MTLFPISPRFLATLYRFNDVQWDPEGRVLFWSESRGKQTLLRRWEGQAPQDLFRDLSLRPGVGYGGGDFGTGPGFVVFVANGRLYRQDLPHGLPRPITPAFGGFASPTVSPDGRWVLFVHTYEDVDVLAGVPADGSQWPRILARGADFYMQPAWHPSMDYVAWPDAGPLGPWTIHPCAAPGRRRRNPCLPARVFPRRPLPGLPGAGRQPGYPLSLRPEHRRSTSAGDRPGHIAPRLGAGPAGLHLAGCRNPGRAGKPPGVDPGPGRQPGGRGAGNGPGALHVVATTGGCRGRPARGLPGLFPADTRTGGGLGTDTSRPPAIVSVHGGPTSQRVANFNAQAAFFTSRGYAYVELNYRGSTGYDYLTREGLADGRRLAIMGGSAGGYTVLNTLIRHPDVFRVGIALYPVTDLFALDRETHKFERRYTAHLVGPLPEAAARYRAWSPLYHAERLRTPIALFQGSEDKVVPPNQTERLVEALRRNRVPHIFRLYEGEGHGFRKPETLEDLYITILHFLEEHLL